MAMPMWSSTLKIFFWYDDSSLAERFSAASTTKSLDRSPSAAAPWSLIDCGLEKGFRSRRKHPRCWPSIDRSSVDYSCPSIHPALHSRVQRPINRSDRPTTQHRPIEQASAPSACSAHLLDGLERVLHLVQAALRAPHRHVRIVLVAEHGCGGRGEPVGVGRVVGQWSRRRGYATKNSQTFPTRASGARSSATRSNRPPPRTQSSPGCCDQRHTPAHRPARGRGRGVGRRGMQTGLQEALEFGVRRVVIAALRFLATKPTTTVSR